MAGSGRAARPEEAATIAVLVATAGTIRRPPHRRRLGIIAKLKNHEGSTPVLGMSRVVAISRSIPVLFKKTTNLHDLQRTVLLAPLLDQVNCVVESRLMSDALTIVVVAERRLTVRPVGC